MNRTDRRLKEAQDEDSVRRDLLRSGAIPLEPESKGNGGGQDRAECPQSDGATGWSLPHRDER